MTRGDLVKTVSSLATGINETRGVLRQIKEGHQLKRASLFLQCLCFSFKSLTLADLVETLAVDSEGSGCFFEIDKLEDPTEIATICSSLVTTHEVQDLEGKVNARRTKITISHRTVQEYLLSKNNPLDFYLEPDSVHTRLGKICLLYEKSVCDQGLMIIDIINKRSLVEYAAANW